MQITETVLRRRSTRAFLADPVPEDSVREIMEKALRAPSGGNLQAWKVHVLTGAIRGKVVSAVQKQFDLDPVGEATEHQTYPANIVEPYRSRRWNVGQQLYQSVGVAKEDKPKKLKYLRRNFEFFGAPVGMFFTIERKMEPLQWTDLGMFIHTIIMLAEEQGLATCCQGAWTMFAPTVKKVLKLPSDEVIACGFAMGYADNNSAINGFTSERAQLGEIVTFHE